DGRSNMHSHLPDSRVRPRRYLGCVVSDRWRDLPEYGLHKGQHGLVLRAPNLVPGGPVPSGYPSGANGRHMLAWLGVLLPQIPGGARPRIAGMGSPWRLGETDREFR